MLILENSLLDFGVTLEEYKNSFEITDQANDAQPQNLGSSTNSRMTVDDNSNSDFSDSHLAMQIVNNLNDQNIILNDDTFVNNQS